MDITKQKNIELHDATKLVHGGVRRSHFGETCEALYLTQSFVYDSAEAAEARFNGKEEGFIYSRYANPTIAMFQDRISLLEKAEACFATASGMAAVFSSIACQTKAGDHVIAGRSLFSSCRWIIEKLLPQYGIAVTLVDNTDIEAWKSAVQPNTSVFFLESPTNPTLEIIDIKEVANLAHSNNAKLIVDNVLATPILQKPLELGADIVVYSATKHIDGQGRCLGGLVLADKKWMDETYYDFFRHTGPAISPFNAWILLKGLETLPLRVESQTKNATQIANYLADKPGVKRVIYPGRDDHPQAELASQQMQQGSTVLAFELSQGKTAAYAFENALQIIQISNNLGDAKSLITHPITTTHKDLGIEECSRLGISEGLLRLSVGLEDTEDLLYDIEQALEATLKI